MSTGDGLRDIFLAGVGAMALTGEKAKDVVDKLIEQGEISVEQGKEITMGLAEKAHETSGHIEEAALEAHLRHLSAPEREAFMAKIESIIDKIDAEEEPEAIKVEKEAVEEGKPAI